MELAGRGHKLTDLLDGYPATVVKGLLSASRVLKRRQLVEHTMALAVAVTGALDLALNRGKGRVLDKWLGEMMPEEGKGRARTRKAKMSERALAVFTSMPRKKA